MIFRAMFWIAVVAVMMPREPDLGLGRPGSAEGILSKITSAVTPGQPACQDNEMACMAATGIVGKLHGVALSGLADVKAQIEEAKRERAARHNG